MVKHIHQYARSKLNKDYYVCLHPDCRHRMHRKELIGKRSLCNVCGRDFILTKEDLRRAKPRCIDCSNTKEAKALKAAKSIAEELFKDAQYLPIET